MSEEDVTRNTSCSREEQVGGLLLLLGVEEGGGQEELPGGAVPVTPGGQGPAVLLDQTRLARGQQELEEGGGSTSVTGLRISLGGGLVE